MSAQLPLPARWAEEIADALRDPDERLDHLARDKRTIVRSIRELIEWLVVRHIGAPADAAGALDAYLDTMIDNATLPIRRRAYDDLMADDEVMRFVRQVARRPLAGSDRDERRRTQQVQRRLPVVRSQALGLELRSGRAL